MNWLDLTENPKALSSIFASVPSLDDVEIMSIKADRDGPTLDLVLALNEYPASPPQRWSHEANAVTLHLQLIGVQSLDISGWSTTNPASVRIERTESPALRVTAIGTTTKLLAIADFVRISHISAYHRVASETHTEN